MSSEALVYIFGSLGLIWSLYLVILHASDANDQRKRNERITMEMNASKAKKRMEAERRVEEYNQKQAEERGRAEAFDQTIDQSVVKAQREARKKADTEAQVKWERDLQKQREQDERDENRVTNTIALMQRSLPFYCSVTEEEGSESHAGKLRWKGVLQALKATDESDATLYFVKLLSLLDNKEYYKIGMTAKSVEERFETSTQIELLEVVATFTAARYLVLFAEYHFIREFEITDELSKLPDMSGPDVKFSGSSEVVRANARGKISGFFEKLKGYEDKVVKGVIELV